MISTMMDYPLTIQAMFRHGHAVYGDSCVIAVGDGGATTTTTFAATARRAEQLAAALARLGVRTGDRVATLGWNTRAHLEAYFAVPSMGAVLHTANPRLHASELAYTLAHAGAKIIIADRELVTTVEAMQQRGELPAVEHVIAIGDAYEALLAAEPTGFAWPELDERAAAMVCYTSGTTGQSKGVVYSHRSMYLHSLAITSGAAFALSERDRVLPVVPMFHANAWGLPYAAWLVGADLVLPGRDVGAAAVCRLIGEHAVTFAAAVPTVWSDVTRTAAPGQLASVRTLVCGGAAVPRALIEQVGARHGVELLQVWGMTETGPIAAIARPPRQLDGDSELDWRARTGRVLPGVEARIVDDCDGVLPWDGVAVGEIQVRGPWCTGAYHQGAAGSASAATPDKFDRGWLRTGDIAAIHPNGFLRITDRAKDVIKSGGEWISSVELEGALMAHPDVVEASVIGVPDERWTERPLACVVARPGVEVTPHQLRAFLSARVARWWLPERWSFVREIPKTSVGKFDKKVLRAAQAAGQLVVVEVQS